MLLCPETIGPRNLKKITILKSGTAQTGKSSYNKNVSASHMIIYYVLIKHFTLNADKKLSFFCLWHMPGKLHTKQQTNVRDTDITKKV